MDTSEAGVVPDATDSWREVAEFLGTPAAFATGEAPEVVETHISRVYLGRKYVYKLKKPVHFDFLDYATLEARRQACEDEVRLNRRLAPDVYIGVETVRRDARGRLVLGGQQGAVVEWIVVMRRLPASRMLDRLLAHGRLDAGDQRALAAVLARFYRQAEPVPMSAEAYLERLAEHVRGNRQELLRPEHLLPVDLVERLHGRQLQFIAFEAPLIAERVASGRIIDGHGDLRAEHVCMEDPPVIYDCVEFNADLRQIDAIDELCFLAMDCERLGARDLGEAMLAAYRTATGDRPQGRLLDFYKAYRACVRAKVTALRSLQLSNGGATRAAEQAQAYLEFADRTFGWSSQPLCVIVRGLIGSGKSTITHALAETLGMAVLQSDQVRRDVVQGGAGAYDQGRYTPAGRALVYDEMVERASAKLSQRVSVILDACFLTHAAQRQVLSLTQALGVPLLVVTCVCPDAVATARIIRRAREPGCLSEARPEHLALQRHEDEGALPQVPHLTIDTARGAAAENGRVLTARLGSLLAESRPAGDGG